MTDDSPPGNPTELESLRLRPLGPVAHAIGVGVVKGGVRVWASRQDKSITSTPENLRKPRSKVANGTALARAKAAK